jgi:hypothetical protein
MEQQIALTVAIVFENRLTLIAATHDVIERPAEIYPRLSRHNDGDHNLQTAK